MSRHPQPRGTRGSLRWIQELINAHPEIIDQLVIERLDGSVIQWLSPMESDDFAEYRDRSAFDLLSVGPLDSPLRAFWPLRGPQWDGLGRSNAGEVILVEAKAHVDELFSGGSKAGAKSLAQIEASLQQVRDALGVRSEVDWTGSLYQYCNRLAHLHFLRSQDVAAWLVNCYFYGDSDMGGPMSPDGWRGALAVVDRVLGLGRHSLRRYMIDVFVDVGDLARVSNRASGCRTRGCG